VQTAAASRSLPPRVARMWSRSSSLTADDNRKPRPITGATDDSARTHGGDLPRVREGRLSGAPRCWVGWAMDWPRSISDWALSSTRCVRTSCWRSCPTRVGSVVLPSFRRSRREAGLSDDLTFPTPLLSPRCPSIMRGGRRPASRGAGHAVSRQSRRCPRRLARRLTPSRPSCRWRVSAGATSRGEENRGVHP
jgi:hypothetical protein